MDIIFGNYKSFNNISLIISTLLLLSLINKMRLLRRGHYSIMEPNSFTLRILIILTLAFTVSSIKVSKIKQDKLQPSQDNEEDVVYE